MSSGYVVVVEGDDEGGYSAFSPALPGCVAAAGAYDECVAIMREAIAEHLDVMREHGEAIPEPSAAGAFTVTAA